MIYRALANALALAVLGSPGLALAQEARLEGTVRVGDQLADSGTVVLHRVGSDSAGEVDSVSVGPDGGFSVRLPTPLDPSVREVFFASIRRDGILYFGTPIHDTAELDSTYVIQAYPSRLISPGTMVPVRVRNVFAEPSDSGWVVTDLFELHNANSWTLVAAPGGDSWSHQLPTGATDFTVGQSDLPSDKARFDGGALSTSAPIPPSESVYLVRYRVTEPSLVIPADTPTETFELLIKEPAPEVSVNGLAAMEPVEVDGSTYRRFAAAGLPPLVVRVVPGSRWSPTGTIPWLGVILAMVLAAIGAMLAVKKSGPGGGRPVLVEVARLDEDQAKGLIAQEDYERRREALLRKLR